MQVACPPAWKGWPLRDIVGTCEPRRPAPTAKAPDRGFWFRGLWRKISPTPRTPPSVLKAPAQRREAVHIANFPDEILSYRRILAPAFGVDDTGSDLHYVQGQLDS